MSVFDTGLNPTPALPAPPANLLQTLGNFAGGMFNQGMSNLKNDASSIGQDASSLISNAPKYFNQGLSDFGQQDPFTQGLGNLEKNTDFNSFFGQANNDISAMKQDASSFANNDILAPEQQSIQQYMSGAQNSTDQGGLGGGLAYVATHSPAEGLVSDIGKVTEQQLGNLQSETQASPNDAGLTKQADILKEPLYDTATMAKGVAGLVADSPQISDQLQNSLHDGIKGALFDKGVGWSNQDTQNAFQDLLDASNTVTNNILGPDQMKQALTNNFEISGLDQKNSAIWADSLSGPLSMFTQLFLAGGAGSAAGVEGATNLAIKAMTAQFALQILSNPMQVLRTMEQQSVGAGLDKNQPDYSVWNLIKKVYSASQGGKGPSQAEVAYGLSNMVQVMSNLLPVLGVKHIAKSGIETTRSTIDAYKEARQGGAVNAEEPANIQQGNGETSASNPPRAVSEAIEGRNPTQIQAAEAVGSATTAARQGENAQATNIPETGTEPLSEVGKLNWDTSNVTPQDQDLSRGQFGLGGSPYWRRGGLLDSEHIRFAEDTLEQTGNNVNGIIDRVRVAPKLDNENHRAEFSIEQPNQISVSSDHIKDTLSHVYNWNQKIKAFLAGEMPQGMDQQLVQRAIQVAQQHQKDLAYLEPKHLLADVVNHEAVHAQILDMADGGEIDKSDEGVAANTIRFLNLLRSTPEGMQWLEDSKQRGLNGQISLLEKISNSIDGDASNKDIANILRGHLRDDTRNSIIEAARHVEEYFNYQINRHQGTNTHPYILQSGEEAYAHSFWNPDETERNASLAGAWWDKYGPAAENPIAGSYSAAARSRATRNQLATGVAASEPVTARYSAGPGGSTPPDKTGLEALPKSDTQAARSEISTEKLPVNQVIANLSGQIESTTRDLETKLQEFQQSAEAAKNPQEAQKSADAARTAMQRVQTAFDAWTQNIHTMQKTVGEVQSLTNMVEAMGRLGIAVDQLRDRLYNTEMDRLSSVDFRDPLFKLQTVATKAVRAREELVAATQRGVTPKQLKTLQDKATMTYAQFSRAYDLHNSPEYRETNAYKPNRAVNNLTQRIVKTLTNRNSPVVDRGEFAAGSVGLTVKDAMNHVRNAYMGVFPDDPRHDPRNWDESFMDIIRGDAAEKIANERSQETNVALGFNNIPLEHLLEEAHSIVDLERIKSDAYSAFSRHVAELTQQLNELKLQRRAKVPGSDAKVKLAEKQVKIAQAEWENHRRRIDRIIRAHPDIRRSAENSVEEMTAEDIQEASTINAPQAIDNAKRDIEETPTGDLLREEIRMINDGVNTPSHNPVDLTSMDRPGNSRDAQEPVKIFSDLYQDAHEALIAEGGDSARLAQTGYSLLREMGEGLDPGRNTFHPAQWFKKFWNSLFGIDYRVNQLSTIARNLVPDDAKSNDAISRRILRPIEYISKDPGKAKQLLSEMNPKEASLAKYLHEMWDTSGRIIQKSGLVDGYVQDFVPHIIKKLPDGTVVDPRRPRVSSRFTESSLARMRDSVTNKPIFEFLTDLEREGYEVEWNLPTILDAHLRSTFRAMRNYEMVNYFMKTIHNDETVNAPPVIPMESWQNAMKNPNWKGVDLKNYTSVKYGPYQNSMKRYYIYKPLADQMNALAHLDDVPGVFSTPAKVSAALNGIYKFSRFAVNPVHALNVWSNIGSAVSRTGAADLTMFNKIWGRANRAMMPEHRSSSFNLVQGLKGKIPGLKGFNTQETDSAAKISTLQKQHIDLQNKLDDLLQEKATTLSQTHKATSLEGAQKAIGKIQNDILSKNAEIARLEKQIADSKIQLDRAKEAYNSIQWIRDQEILPRLMGKGLVPDKDINLAADIGLSDRITQNTPGLRQWHHWMWHDMVWKGQMGVALELRDQLVKKYARSLYQYKGKSVMEAERLLSPEEIDNLETEAVYYAKNATGLWNQVDNSMFNNLYGRSLMLSMSWTMGQARNVRDVLGNNVLTRKLGRDDTRPFSQTMKEAGYDPKSQEFLDRLHSQMARRMVFGGIAKLFATAMVTSSLGSYILSGRQQVTTPIQNFQKDPIHTFDIYAGTDPATGKPIWRSFPFYGAQREIAQYVLAGVKAQMEGKGADGDAAAVAARITNKFNPAGRNLFELVSGIEVAKLMNGAGAPDISSDNDIANLERALNSYGVPDGFPLEDRLLYWIREDNPLPPPISSVGVPQTVPIKRDSTGKPILDENGKEIPLTDPKSMMTNFFGPTGPLDYDAIAAISHIPGYAQVFGSNAVTQQGAQMPSGNELTPLGLYAFGSGSTESTSVQAEIQRQQKDAQTQQRNDLTIQLVDAAKKGDIQKVQQIKTELGMTNGQTVDTILHGARLNSTGTSSTGSSGFTSGILSTPGDKGVAAATNINGHTLTPTEQDQYNQIVGNRDLYVINQLQKDPTFQNANQVEKSTMMNSYLALTDKIAKEEYAQQSGLSTGGAPIDDQSFKAAMFAYQQTRDDAAIVLGNDPTYRNADPNTKQRMQDTYDTIASTMAYDRVYGDYKNMSDSQFTAFVRTSMYSGLQTRNYLQNVQFYQQASPQDQARMETEYTNLASTMTKNVYTGKVSNVMPMDIPNYMQSIVNTEESSKYLLHQTDFYQQASLAEQQKLDTKYQNLARSLADKDWSNGTPMLDLNNVSDQYTAGPDKIMLGHIVADQAFSDFQSQYGGTDLITSQEQELAAIHKQIAETTDANPKTITYLKNRATAIFYTQNPNYASYIKARSVFERNTSVGRLYASLNSDEQALATNDLTYLEATTGLGTTMDQPSALDSTQYSDISGTDAAGLPVDSTGITIDPSADLTQIGTDVSNTV